MIFSHIRTLTAPEMDIYPRPLRSAATLNEQVSVNRVSEYSSRCAAIGNEPKLTFVSANFLI
jgi:hypothetical protein